MSITLLCHFRAKVDYGSKYFFPILSMSLNVICFQYLHGKL